MPLTKVLRTIPFFYPYVTGPGKQAFHISRGLEAAGIASPVVTTNHQAPQSPPEEDYQGVRVVRLTESVGFLAYRLVRGDLGVLEQDAQIIHTHCYRNHLTTLSHRIARRKGIPFVIQPHGTLLMYRYILPRVLHLPYIGYDWFTHKREVIEADAVVVATEQEKDEAIDFGVAPQRIHVIPVGVATDNPVQRKERHDGPLTVLFVGRITPDRCVERILHAASIVKKVGPPEFRTEFRIRIVGPAAVRSTIRSGSRYIKRLTALSMRLGLGDCVDFVGPRYGEELTEEYLSADLFVYTSIYENFGQTVLEAAYHGLPVIATPTGVASDIITDGQTGSLVAFDDDQQLADRLLQLLTNPEQRTRYGRAIQAIVLEHYGWETVLAKYRRLYESLLGNT